MRPSMLGQECHHLLTACLIEMVKDLVVECKSNPLLMKVSNKILQGKDETEVDPLLLTRRTTVITLGTVHVSRFKANLFSRLPTLEHPSRCECDLDFARCNVAAVLIKFFLNKPFIVLEHH